MQIMLEKMQPDGIGHKCPRCLSPKGDPRYRLTYAGIDFPTTGTNEETIGHFTFLGSNATSLIGQDEILLVPEPAFPPTSTPRWLLEPIGKGYAMTTELTDNSLDSDNLCFQVNAAEEIHPFASQEIAGQGQLSIDILQAKPAEMSVQANH